MTYDKNVLERRQPGMYTLARGRGICAVTENQESKPKLFYIYALVDPRDNSTFYVGCTSNTKTRGLAAKSYWGPIKDRIREIRTFHRPPVRDTRLRPRREILATATSPLEAHQLETSTIELLRSKGEKLLNSPNCKPYPGSCESWNLRSNVN